MLKGINGVSWGSSCCGSPGGGIRPGRSRCPAPSAPVRRSRLPDCTSAGCRPSPVAAITGATIPATMRRPTRRQMRNVLSAEQRSKPTEGGDRGDDGDWMGCRTRGDVPGSRRRRSPGSRAKGEARCPSRKKSRSPLFSFEGGGNPRGGVGRQRQYRNLKP